METVLFVVLGNFTIIFLVVGLIASGISLALRPKPLAARTVVEDLFAYFLLFSIVISLLYNFAFHVFAGEFAASLIGWADSPFQAEVGDERYAAEVPRRTPRGFRSVERSGSAGRRLPGRTRA